MQKETKNILWVAVGSFFSGVIITFALLCLAVAITRPCPKMMGPMPMNGMHEQNAPRHIGVQNHTRDLKRERAPHAKEMGKHPEMRKHHAEPAQEDAE